MNNIRSLQLFYYVARHGGVSQAAKHMPYGIQQPALSEQMIELEQQLESVTALVIPSFRRARAASSSFQRDRC
jgi:hypothetical protein